MNAFPQTIHFIGSNFPRRAELSIRDLAVEGEIPADIDGAFFRAVPDNAHVPMFEDDVALNADGMIARFSIERGAVDFDIRELDHNELQAIADEVEQSISVTTVPGVPSAPVVISSRNSLRLMR